MALLSHPHAPRAAGVAPAWPILPQGQLDSCSAARSVQSPRQFRSTIMPSVPRAGPLVRGPPSGRPGITDRLRELTTEEKKRPFLDDRPLEEQKSVHPWEDFKRPRLKRCAPPPDIEWLEQLGHGVDGTVWKVKIAGTVYALKVVCIGPICRRVVDCVANFHSVLGQGTLAR